MKHRPTIGIAAKPVTRRASDWAARLKDTEGRKTACCYQRK
jgi:hypothetical protein